MPDNVRQLNWFRRHLVGRELGLLSEADEIRFDTLVREDISCRHIWEDFLAAGPFIDGDQEHLPAGLVARWDSVQASLKGTMREVVRQHLMTCEDCREDLMRLGHEPVLESIVDQSQPSSDPEGQANATPGLRVVDGPLPLKDSSQPRWWQNLSGIWATTATAAAAVLAILLMTPTPQIETGILALVQPSNSRSGAQDSTFLVLRPGDRSALLALPVSPTIAEGQDLLVWILGPNDRPVSKIPVGQDQISGSVVPVHWVFSEHPAEGRYRVIMVPAGQGSEVPDEESSWYYFQVIFPDN